MVLNYVMDAITETLKDCVSDNSAFRLEDIKRAYVAKKKQKALEDGLEPESIGCGVSDQTAKIAMIVAAIGDTGLMFSKKKLLTKTETRDAGSTYVSTLPTLVRNWCAISASLKLA